MSGKKRKGGKKGVEDFFNREPPSNNEEDMFIMDLNESENRIMDPQNNSKRLKALNRN